MKGGGQVVRLTIESDLASRPAGTIASSPLAPRQPLGSRAAQRRVCTYFFGLASTTIASACV